MEVFKKSGCTYLRMIRFNRAGSSLELMESIPDWESVILTNENADRDIQEMAAESIAEIHKIIDEKVQSPKSREMLKNNRTFWIGKDENSKDLFKDVPPEIHTAAEPLQLINRLEECAGKCDDILNANCQPEPYLKRRETLMKMIGAAFEAGRCVERGIAGLLLPDVKRGRKVKNAASEGAKLTNKESIEKHNPMKKAAAEKAKNPSKYHSIRQAAEELADDFNIGKSTVKRVCKKELAPLDSNKRIK